MNKFLPLTPDLNAVTEFDVIKAKLEFSIKVAESGREVFEKTPPDDPDYDKIKEAIEQPTKDLAEYNAYIETNKKPCIIKIGYLPASKRTELEQKHSAIVRGAGKRAGDNDLEFTDEELAAIYDLNREYCRWGVKGIDAVEGVNIKYKTQGKGYRGTEYKVCADDVVDFFERNDYLHLIRDAIIDYNRLDTKKKKR